MIHADLLCLSSRGSRKYELVVGGSSLSAALSQNTAALSSPANSTRARKGGKKGRKAVSPHLGAHLHHFRVFARMTPELKVRHSRLGLFSFSLWVERRVVVDGLVEGLWNFRDVVVKRKSYELCSNSCIQLDSLFSRWP